MQVWRPTQEQLKLLGECQALDAWFGEKPHLVASPDAISEVRALIARAVDAELPQIVITPLRIWVSIHDTEMDLPEHLRSFRLPPFVRVSAVDRVRAATLKRMEKLHADNEAEIGRLESSEPEVGSGGETLLKVRYAQRRKLRAAIEELQLRGG